MPKKRSCRRTMDEDRVHEMAVKMRKMTDKQLVLYVEQRVENAREDGFCRGQEAGQQEMKQFAVNEFLARLQDSRIQGIGAVTINKIMKTAREYGYIQ